MTKPKTIRCAIYTRKSHEEGLDQDFNSLDAQREASEAYIKSQMHEGWQVIPTPYDDAAYSGGNMERPALQKLLRDIEAGKIDIVVVYKVDRLSRALGDFAKMVEIFDANNVSFVSVTQAFNTTTSMGRLTLNVLLSFAQFEREVTGERIRDKFAASKKKGLWMGGRQPLGYDVRDRRLVINEAEAKIVRFIFEYYVNNPAGRSLHKLLASLREKGFKNKSYMTQKGKKIVGKEFTINQIYRLLNNQLYLGKMKHKGEVYDGEHDAIIDQELWDRVHTKMDKKQFTSAPQKKTDQPKLVGRLYDYLGHKLSPTYSYKYSSNGRYKMRYYVNREISTQGKTESEFKRIRAELIDDVVLSEIRILHEVLVKGINDVNNHVLSSALLKPVRKLATAPVEHIEKVVLFPKHMELSLCIDKGKISVSKQDVQELLSSYDAELQIADENITITLKIDAQYKRSGGQLLITTENSETKVDAQHHYPDDRTFTMLAKSFYWNQQIDDGIYQTQKEIASTQNHSPEYVKRACKLPFLSPKIVEQMTSKDTSSQLHIEKLIACNHWDWQKQEQVLLPSN